MTIVLPPELENRLKSEASRKGLEPGAFAATLIEQGLRRPDQASLDVLARWEIENETDDVAEITRRQEELREFKNAMNQSRVDSDGSAARKPFP